MIQLSIYIIVTILLTMENNSTHKYWDNYKTVYKVKIFYMLILVIVI